MPTNFKLFVCEYALSPRVAAQLELSAGEEREKKKQVTTASFICGLSCKFSQSSQPTNQPASHPADALRWDKGTFVSIIIAAETRCYAEPASKRPRFKRCDNVEVQIAVQETIIFPSFSLPAFTLSRFFRLLLEKYPLANDKNYHRREKQIGDNILSILSLSFSLPFLLSIPFYRKILRSTI